MSAPQRPFCSLLGYDPEVLAQLRPTHVAHLDSLSQAWLLSSVVLGYPMGVALWMVEHSLWLSTAASLGTSLLVINLLRLTTAGSGTPADHAFPANYRPSLTPVVLLLGLALLLSQPAQLVSAPQSALLEVQQHRAALQTSHAEAQLALGDSGADAFSEQLERCEFVVLRLRLLWDRPETMVLWTAVYLALTLLPALLARVTWLDAGLAYERARHATAQQRMLSLLARGDRAVEQALAQFPTYRRDALRRLGPPLCRPLELRPTPERTT